MSTSENGTAAVIHSTFTIERVYQASPAKVFRGFSDPERKRRWFAEGEGWEVTKFEMDFRIGGRETCLFHPVGGPPMSNVIDYQDIVEGRRIVCAYTMVIAGAPLSSSLLTIELAATATGTKLLLTEQAAYYGGQDGTKDREAGTRELLDKLAEELAQHP